MYLSWFSQSDETIITFAFWVGGKPEIYGTTTTNESRLKKSWMHFLFKRVKRKNIFASYPEVKKE